MKLNYQSILNQLAIDYNHKIMSNTLPYKSAHDYESLLKLKKKRKRFSYEIYMLENEVMSLLALHLNKNEVRQSKRPKFYNMSKPIFTDPETGIR